MTAIKVTYTADHVLDATDAATGERHSLYRCNSCKALLESMEVQDHFAWHGTLLYYAAPDADPAPALPRHACACGHGWRQHDDAGCMFCGCSGTRHQ